MSFISYDVAFLVLFLVAFVLFLIFKKHNLKRQGLLYLYRTKIGIKLIDWTAKKFSKVLKPLQYVVIASGYFLMGLIIWFLAKFSYMYLTSPTIAKAIKVPVLLPLIPYLPELFKLDFLPHFYFTYWIIIIAVIAIPHEFAHGIFARLNKIKVHSTGFGFLGPFLAAFVEPDEKAMAKSKKFSQLSVLASGTFANILVAIFFGLLMILFFASAFSPAGVIFNTYSTSYLNVSDVSVVGNYSAEGFAQLNLIEVKLNNLSYFTSQSALDTAKLSESGYLAAYDDSPAFKARLSGAITEINGNKITSQEELSSIILSSNPGDKLEIKTINVDTEEIKDYSITLSESNEVEGKAFLGIGVIPTSSLISSKIMGFVSKIKNPSLYYSSVLGGFGIFIYDLLWWIVLINISVALVNMVPVGIFDGGRFFYLTILGITKSEKTASKAFKISTALFITLVILLMVKWFFAII